MNNNFVKYQDLINITELESKTKDEEFVLLPETGDKVIGKYVTELNELEYSPIIRVRKEVFRHFIEMKAEAFRTAGIDLIIDSGYRSAEYQKDIWYANYFKYYSREFYST